MSCVGAPEVGGQPSGGGDRSGCPAIAGGTRQNGPSEQLWQPRSKQNHRFPGWRPNRAHRERSIVRPATPPTFSLPDCRPVRLPSRMADRSRVPHLYVRAPARTQVGQGAGNGNGNGDGAESGVRSWRRRPVRGPDGFDAGRLCQRRSGARPRRKGASLANPGRDHRSLRIRSCRRTGVGNNPGKVWTRADARERHCKAQHARTIDITLPRDLPPETWPAVAAMIFAPLARRAWCGTCRSRTCRLRTGG